MKRILPAALVVCALSTSAQTLFVPSGTSGIGTSSTGNVGIGTSSPQETLHINGNLRGSVNGAVRISTGYGTMDIGAQNSGHAHFYTNMPDFFFGNPIVVAGSISSHISYDLNLQTAGTTRMSILNSNGNVGIGTAAPADQLEVVSGNRKVGFNTTVAGASTGGILSLSRPDDGAKILYLGGAASPTDDQVIFGQGGSGELRLVSAGGGSSGFGFYTNISMASAFGSARPTPVVKIDGSGNAGIGTNSPQSLLHINSTVDARKTLRLYWNNDLTKYLSVFQGTTGAAIDPIGTGVLSLGYDQITNVLVNGKLGIGTTQPDYPLTVNGSIHAKEVRVDLNVPAPDYVFEKEYKLTSLDDIKKFIDQNKHLPEVPSAKEMEKNGVQLGEMNLILLKKIEELTLHAIEQNKTIQEMRKEINDLKTKK